MPLISESLRNLSSALIIAALIITGLVAGREILIPMTLAVLLAFILSPIVLGLTRARISRGLAVGLVMLGTVASIAGFTILVSKQVISLTAGLSQYSYNVLEKVRVISGRPGEKSEISRAAEAVDKLGAAIRKEITGSESSDTEAVPTPPNADKTIVVEKETGASPGLLDYLGSVIGPLAQAALAILLTTFLLLQYQDLRDRVVRVVGTDHMTDTISAMGEAGERLSRLFLMQALLNGGFGLVVGTALWLIGVPNAILWGVVAGVMRFVPYVGSFISAIPPMLVAAAVDPGWGKFLATAAVFVIGEPLMGHIVEPQALGKRAGISPFAMVTSASFWTLVWGPIGLILAAPLTMTLVVIGRYIAGLEFFSVLLGDEPALSPPHELYHRLLSEDSASAANQIDDALGESSFGAVSDDLIMPALYLAAQDHRRGRLDKEQIEELAETSSAVWSAISDDMAVDDVGEAPNGKERLLVIPARGAIDRIAAEFVARAIEAKTGTRAATVSSSSGLTAISDAKSWPEGDQPSELLIACVSGIDAAQLGYIVRRAEREFSETPVYVVDFRSGFDLTRPLEGNFGDHVTIFKTASAAIGHFEVAARAQAVRHFSEERTVLAAAATA